jgi:hypothetical protein
MAYALTISPLAVGVEASGQGGGGWMGYASTT